MYDTKYIKLHQKFKISYSQQYKPFGYHTHNSLKLPQSTMKTKSKENLRWYLSVTISNLGQFLPVVSENDRWHGGLRNHHEHHGNTRFYDGPATVIDCKLWPF